MSLGVHILASSMCSSSHLVDQGTNQPHGKQTNKNNEIPLLDPGRNVTKGVAHSGDTCLSAQRFAVSLARSRCCGRNT